MGCWNKGKVVKEGVLFINVVNGNVVEVMVVEEGDVKVILVFLIVIVQIESDQGVVMLLEYISLDYYFDFYVYFGQWCQLYIFFGQFFGS